MNPYLKKKVTVLSDICKSAASLTFLMTLFIVSVHSVSGQQLDQLKKEDILKVNGGIGFNQNLYFSNGIQDRFSPYSYILSGHLNISVLGFSAPLSFTYTNQKVTYRAQPFNIIGISPSYKSLKLHAGYRNMTFSPYTLNGHSFLGGGAEWTHKGFYIGVMGGRFLRATEYDSIANTQPVYARYGGAIKLGYIKDGEEFTVISLYGKDDAGSIAAPPASTGLRPNENQVYSVMLKKRLAENLFVHFEGASSGWTKDTEIAGDSSTKKTGYENLYFMPVNVNTVFYTAFKTGFTFARKKGSMGVSFERVGPEYRTMGAYYFNSDFQNLTANYATRLFKEKLTVGLNGGVQRDDLKNQKMSRMKRFVGSVNLSAKVTERLNLTANYSNFNSFTNIKPVDRAFIQNTVYDRIDTMNYVQVTQSASAGINYKPLDNSRLVHTTSLNGNYTGTSNKTGSVEVANNIASASLSHNINWKESGVTLGGNLNGNKNSYTAGNSYFYGVGMNLAFRMWKKKISTSFTGNFSENFERGNLVAYLFTVGNNWSLKIGKHQSLGLNLRYTGRVSRSQSEFSYYNTSFREFLGSLGYNFFF